MEVRRCHHRERLTQYPAVQGHIKARLKLMSKVMKGIIDLKAEVREQRKDIRHLHHIVMKSRIGITVTENNENEEEEILTDFIPCFTYRDLQDLDQKLGNNSFFENAVSTQTEQHSILKFEANLIPCKSN